MYTPPITFIIGNGNNGYCLELCIKSYMKYNKQFTQQIIVADNNSTDFSLDFIEKLPYKDLVKIVKYNNDMERNMASGLSMYEHIHVGLNHCSTDWALLTHVDTYWKLPVVPRFYDILNESPDLFMSGLGGGNPNLPEAIIHQGRVNGTRFHEWLLFINVPEWKKSGYSFRGTFDASGIFYDTAAYMYRQAYNAGRKLVSFGNYESQSPYVENFVGCRGDKKAEDSLKSKEILDREFPNE